MTTFITSTIFSAFALVLMAIPSMAQALPQGDWQLKAYNFDSKIHFAVDQTPLTLNVKADGTFGGRSSCNSYGGKFLMEEDKRRFADIFSTMMACDETAMQFEQAFLRTLEGSTKMELGGGKLTIMDETNSSFLQFVAVRKPKRCFPSSARSN